MRVRGLHQESIGKRNAARLLGSGGRDYLACIEGQKSRNWLPGLDSNQRPFD